MEINLYVQPIRVSNFEDFKHFAESNNALLHIVEYPTYASVTARIELAVLVKIGDTPVWITHKLPLVDAIEKKTRKYQKIPVHIYRYKSITGVEVESRYLQEREERYKDWDFDKVGKKIQQLARKLAAQKGYSPTSFVIHAIEQINKKWHAKFEKQLEFALAEAKKFFERLGYIEGRLEVPSFNVVEAEY